MMKIETADLELEKEIDKEQEFENKIDKNLESSKNYITIKGARVHNLKNISVRIPRDKFVVFTGLSGSGKSSLAFDTIYAEGHRRFVESLSSYARQFLGQLDKPDVDYIEGLSPAVSIDQKTTSRNPRSTIGTITEIYDYLRLLFARVGIPHCPVCGKIIKQQTIDQIIDQIMEEIDDGEKFYVLSPVVKGKKGMHEKIFEDAKKGGFARVRADGSIYDLTEQIALDKNKKHDIDILVDRLVMRKDREDMKTRLTDSVETASNLSNGIVVISILKDENVQDGGNAENEDDKPEEMVFSQNYACEEHGISIGELAPRMFSFNSPFGACPECSGLGVKQQVSVDKLLFDRTKSIRNGAIVANGFKTMDNDTYGEVMLEAVGAENGFTLDTPISNYSEPALSALLFGTGSKEYWAQKGNHRFKFRHDGIVNTIMRRYNQTGSSGIKAELENLMEDVNCSACGGKRLKQESLSVRVKNMNIYEMCSLSILESKKFFDAVTFSKKEAVIAKDIVKEIRERLGFLVSVGLDYLTLERRAGTLSGGESQRIRLATQIGSSLMGVLYILDEPSIGLHQRDNSKLINALKRLRDVGNTVIVVEHDEETIEEADYVVDLGPYAGVNGGEVVAQGTVAEIKTIENSITGQFLSGKRRIKTPSTEERRKGNGSFVKIINAHENNLKHIDVTIPLGMFVCITGVSGSGKSSLINEILYKKLANELNGAYTRARNFDRIEGTEALDKIIAIDQSPIGRTPRSNPATYTGLFADIRMLFAETQDAKMRGFKPDRFSFNMKGGRCEACEGDGVIKIEMHFLPDVYVTCDVCKGRRYSRETLEVKYKGKNIFDVLDMTVEEGVEFFANIPRISNRLRTLNDVGLGYIKIGQSSTTLSGGEAQRVKLSTELSKRATGRTIYVLDEPTTGLHIADVEKLIEVLQKLVEAGNTVIVIEHNLDMIKTADYIIDLGPEGGDNGGQIVTQGTPEEVAARPESYTGQYLKKIFDKEKKIKM
ncbi:MAG: excinuclease ABC subunit UvrA [Oscillospiraceae bacterium]|nr:excinuclease ABC subunit UvrA [Oscillospiraceae bacterium]